LISPDPAVREKQLATIAESISAGARQETERLLPEVAPIATKAILPLAGLALPALRRFSPSQYQQFSAVIQSLIDADGEIDLFEYVLQKIVLRHLDPQFNGIRKTPVQFYAIKPLVPDCAVLLSGLAQMGSDDPIQVEKAFRNGAARLSYQAQVPMGLVPVDQCDLPQIDAALNRLCQAVPQIKKNVIDACTQVVAADGVIQEVEAELLRAIADTLDCPMPPFLQTTAEAPAQRAQ
jgi:hypothetical protein